MKGINLFFLLVLATGVLRSQNALQPIEIEAISDEKWWGAFVNEGYRMPYEKREDLLDLSKENRSNQAVPFLLSSKGRFVWSRQPFSFTFDGNTLTIHSSFEKVDVESTEGNTLKSALLQAAATYFPPTGTLPDSMLFTHPQYNTWIELDYKQNQKDILDYARSILKYGFPPGVLMIDDGWQKYYGNFDFKPDRFPDPHGMIKELHAMGFKVMLWVCPLVSPDSPEYRMLQSKGYLLKRPGHWRAAPVDWWNGFSACLDLTHPGAFEYMKNTLLEVKEKYNIDGYKLDAGDIGHYLDKAYNDSTALPVDQVKKWAEIGLNFSLNEYRACWKMAGQPLVQRLSDKWYAWEDVAKLIPNMTAAGLLGYAYACPDMIGGGEIQSFLKVDPATFDQELIVRSCQIHALMPMMQFSVAPWRILDERHRDICRDYAQLHYSMSPYIMKWARHASQTGEPMARHLAYEFPGQGFERCKDQFMLGDRILVAPMTRPGYSRQVVLPKGDWKDDRGVSWKGGKTITIDVPIDRLPRFELMSKE